MSRTSQSRLTFNKDMHGPRVPQSTRRRVGLAVAAAATLSLAAIVISPAEAFGNELRGVLRNNSGVSKFEQKNGGQALDDFTGALGDLPFAGEVHFNVGNGFLLRREYEKALSEYREAVKNAPGDSARARETRFRALFNSAVVLSELKKTDEALATYQQALALNPSSIETKTNIELLTAQAGGDGGGDDKDQKDDKSGKGQGDGKDKNDNKDKDKDNKDQNDKKNQDQKFENPKPTPREFKSEELSKQDVKRILEELKRQEEQIRARMQNEQRKDAPPAKDW